MDFSKSSQNALQQLKINEINQDPRSFFVQRRRFTVPRSAPCTTDQKTENERHPDLAVVLLVLHHALIRAEETVSSDLSQQSKFNI